MKKLITSTRSYCFAQKMILILVLGLSFIRISAQCTGCTSTVSTNVNITVNSGQVVCLTYAGTYNKTITFNGGTLCISPATIVSSAITINSGCSLNVYGRVTGSITQNSGAITVDSGAVFSPSAILLYGGTLTNYTGGSVTFLSTVNISSSVTFISSGTFTANNLINNSGTVTMSGTVNITGTLTNNGSTVNVTGPSATIGSFVANAGTTNFSGGVSISGSVTNYAAINLSGSLSISNNYTSTGSLTANASACNSMTVGGTITSNGGSSYNGNGYNLLISPSPGCTTCMTNGAYTSPTLQPTGLSLSVSGSTVTGTFTSPSASITGYLVLRYVGTTSSAATPTNNTSYIVGNAVGTNTVAAIVSSSATGTKSFTDTVPTGSCGKNIYYRIFSFSGSGACIVYKTGSPLTGNTAISGSTASITASGVTSFCSGGSVTLTATGGTSYLWSTAATTAAINATSSATYTVTATNASGCTATASSTVTVYANPTLNVSSNTPVCVGATINLTATASGSSSYSYSWSGPGSFTATGAIATVANATTVNGGNYNVTVTDNNSCTSTGYTAVNINVNCIDSTTIGSNGGGSSDAPCTQILRFDHYNDVVASQPGGQAHTWVLSNGNKLTMTITRTGGGMTSVVAPSWSGSAFGQSGYTGLSGKTVLYTTGGGYSKLTFSNIQMKDSLGNIIPNFTLIGIDGESTDNSERDTLVSNGTSWFDYDTITPPNIGSVPSETGIGTNTLVWAGTGSANARARLVSTNNPTNFSFSTIAGGLQGFAMGISNPIQAPTTLTICSNGSFNATPTNLPAGTTYTWSTPTVSPAGSLTGATAQNSPLAIVGQTLINTTSSPATAVYSVIPSNNCSGLGYTVTVTVNPAPSASITSNSPLCVNNNLTVTATAVSGGPLRYSWSGPNSFTSTSNTFSFANAATTQSGTYTVTITGSNTCTASVSTAISVVNCLTVSGNIFDDANGNGKIDTNESKTNYGQTLYSVIADTNGLVISTSTIAADGSFSMSNVLPSSTGMTIRVSTSNPSVGAPAPAYSWAPNWLSTFAQYGTNNLAGSGVYNNTNEIIPVRTGTINITNMYIGFDRLAAPASQLYTITRPALNSVKALNVSAGLGDITWADPEDGTNRGSFAVKSIASMNNNVLFYDSNNNNIAESSEIITGYRVFSNFNDQRLKVKFTALGTSRISFSYGYIDNAGKTNPTASTYTVIWTGGALPVKLISFDAVVDKENKVDLNWATATEIDNAYFEVERSADAVEFSPIAKVDGAGNSTITIDYSTTDNAPLMGTSYYRLKQVDVDGNFTYSDIVTVSILGSTLGQASVKVFPTLITSPNVHIVASGSDVPVIVSVFDMTGRLIATQTIAANSDTEVELPYITQTGMYIVNCNAGNNSTSTKVVYRAR